LGGHIGSRLTASMVYQLTMVRTESRVDNTVGAEGFVVGMGFILCQAIDFILLKD
jgi:hypothetical protein